MRPFRRSAYIWMTILCAVRCLTAPVLADSVHGKPFEVRQPDGEVIQVAIWGDEFYRVVESLDGFTLVPDPKTQVACYATLSATGDDLVSTGVRLGSATLTTLSLPRHIRINAKAAEAKISAARAAAAATEATIAQSSGQVTTASPPSSGNVVGICLLVDFSDDAWTIAPASIESYCNQVGYTGYGNNGSVRDYFYTVSDGRLTYTNFVPTYYYRAAHPKTYYEDNTVSYGTRARELIVEALTDLNNRGFDFSQYDANHDGQVDALNCFYAGNVRNAWSEGLWPHSSNMSYAADGVYTNRYQITNIGTSLRLRTFCHENGHMVCGWPDLYDYGYQSNGVGEYCLMCYGTSDTNPQEPCAYMKVYSGWSSVTLLTSPQAGLPLVASSTNACYKFLHPSKTSEYFLIENRQRSGRDSGLPDSGLAIWHIDTTGSNDNEQMTAAQHYKVTLVQADGRWDLEHKSNYGDSTDLWASPGYTECSPATSPNTNWWSGSPSGMTIRNISASAATMTFDFALSWDCNANGVNDVQDIAAGTSSDCNHNGSPDECDLAEGNARDCDANGVPDACQSDQDQDSLIDACDNCPGVANPDQSNLDKDAEGDACDADDDNDGLPDDADNCPWTANPGQEDADQDGAGDACDICPDTIPGATVNLAGCTPSVRGDFDRDGDVDQADFGHLQACLGQEGQAQTNPACLDTRLDGDLDVDLADLSVFQACYSGPDRAASPLCGP